MKNYSIYVLSAFLSLMIQVQAQTKWLLPPHVSTGLTGATYIPDMQLSAFVSGTSVVYYPEDGSEAFSADMTGYGSLPAGWTRIDAVAKWDAANLMLFKGGEYTLLNVSAPSLQYVGPFPDLPASWGGSFDAASQWVKRQLLLFKGTEYVIFDKIERTMSGLNDLKNFAGWDTSWTQVDAVVNKSLTMGINNSI